MALSGSLSVIVGASIGPLQKGFKKAEGLASSFSSKVSKTIAGPGGIGGAIAGAIAGVSLGAAVKYAIGEFSKVEQAQTKLQSAIKATGGAAGVSVGEITALGKQLSQTTGTSRTAVSEAAAALTKFGQVRGPNFKETIVQATNYAAVMGGDVVSATDKLGSALNNPREGYLELAAAGVKFTNSQLTAIEQMTAAGDVAGAQGVILEALKTQFDGAGEAAGETLTGKLGKLHESFSGIAAEIGQSLAPMLTAGIDLVKGWLDNLDMVKVKSAAFDVLQKAIGYAADTVQLLVIGWKSAKVGVDAMLILALKGFQKLVGAIDWAINGLRKLAGMKALASEHKDLDAFAKGLESVARDDLAELDKAMKAPWASAGIKKATDSFKPIAETAKETGETMTKAFTDPAIALSKEMQAAHAQIDSLMKDLRIANKTFGLSDTEKKAQELQGKGVGDDKIKEFKKLSNDLKGKELAQSLENPLEKFQREMSKLNELKDSMSPEMFARAQSKLVQDFRDAVPDMKTTAGGALKAGSQEARSALLAYQTAGRNADPQQKMVQLLEEQNKREAENSRYLQRMAESSGKGPMPFSGL